MRHRNTKKQPMLPASTSLPEETLQTIQLRADAVGRTLAQELRHLIQRGLAVEAQFVVLPQTTAQAWQAFS